MDYNATTAPDPEVIESMLPWWTTGWANPSSPYQRAGEVARTLFRAREQVASLLDCEPEEVVFNSGATEGVHSVFSGVQAAAGGPSNLCLSPMEHAATLAAAAQWERQGGGVVWLPVKESGGLDFPGTLAELERGGTLVSLMRANNETGVLSPVEELSRMARKAGFLVHSDAVQALGKIPLSFRQIGVDFMTLSAHKVHGPKGIGLLVVRRGARWKPWLSGGGQEMGRRAGTENVAGILGAVKALELAIGRQEALAQHTRRLRDHLEAGLRARFSEIWIHGDQEDRLPNTCQVSFPGLESEAMILMLDRRGFEVSSGSACTTGALEPSHVLTAMGVSSEVAMGALRFSFGKENTLEEVDSLLKSLVEIVVRLGDANRVRTP